MSGKRKQHFAASEAVRRATEEAHREKVNAKRAAAGLPPLPPDTNADRWREGLRKRSTHWTINRPPEVADVHKISRIS